MPGGAGFLTSEIADGIRAATAARHNNGMHPTGDTNLLMYNRWGRWAGDARR